MKKVIITLLLVAVLFLALAGPALADKGGVPNNPIGKGWGRMIKITAPQGDVMKVGQGGLQGGQSWGVAHENIKDAF